MVWVLILAQKQVLHAANYCKEYEDSNYVYAIIACKTYIGDSTVGTVDMSDSELYKDDKVTQHDSLVNDNHVVPCFVIVFTVRSVDQLQEKTAKSHHLSIVS